MNFKNFFFSIFQTSPGLRLTFGRILCCPKSSQIMKDPKVLTWILHRLLAYLILFLTAAPFRQYNVVAMSVSLKPDCLGPNFCSISYYDMYLTGLLLSLYMPLLPLIDNCNNNNIYLLGLIKGLSELIEHVGQNVVCSICQHDCKPGYTIVHYVTDNVCCSAKLT